MANKVSFAIVREKPLFATPRRRPCPATKRRLYPSVGGFGRKELLRNDSPFERWPEFAAPNSCSEFLMRILSNGPKAQPYVSPGQRPGCGALPINRAEGPALIVDQLSQLIALT